MGKATKVHEAIVCLDTAEREELRFWLDAYEEDAWDRQITADAASGRLNFPARQAEPARF